jgi:hypothetical protein
MSMLRQQFSTEPSVQPARRGDAQGGAKSFDTLFIAASFFGYASEIGSVLERRGRGVMWFEDRPRIDNLTKAKIRLAPQLMERSADSYFADIAQQASKHPIRDVFVIKAEAMSIKSLSLMRKLFPKARFTLYFWDSYRNMPANSSAKVDLFDRTFSFDPIDVSKDRRLAYRPLFFLNEYFSLASLEQDIDVLFVGTLHTDRYKVLRNIENCIPKHLSFRKILYVRSRALFGLQGLANPGMWIHPSKADEFIYKPLGKDAMVKLIARSRTVIDIERDIQAGYTMRTLEMLGAGKKLITTNPQVSQADFYDSQNTVVIDRKNPKIDPEFFECPYRTPSTEIVRRYSIESWLDELGFGHSI